MHKEDVDKCTIYKVISGSKSYGTDGPDSDIDIRGICISPKEYWIGLKNFEQYQDLFNDYTIYNIKKFIKLAIDCNPNIIELLFTDEKNILFIDKYGKKLRDNKELFLSTKAKFTFSGYAIAQLKRIKLHYNHINNPIDHKPTVEEFNGYISKGEAFFPNVNRQNNYKEALKKWHQYETWVKNRNPKRAEMEKKYGFDGKHGSHLVRLLRMGEEILSGKGVIVYRPDREYLKGIQKGLLTYEEILKIADEYDKKLENLYNNSPLPKHPDFNKIEEITMEIVEEYLFDRSN